MQRTKETHLFASVISISLSTGTHTQGLGVIVLRRCLLLNIVFGARMDFSLVSTESHWFVSLSECWAYCSSSSPIRSMLCCVLFQFTSFHSYDCTFSHRKFRAVMLFSFVIMQKYDDNGQNVGHHPVQRLTFRLKSSRGVVVVVQQDEMPFRRPTSNKIGKCWQSKSWQ